jgi:hypothetical protein
VTQTLEPVDLKRCQTDRPNTWPQMPSFMTLGPVTFARCTNAPEWIGSDGVGEMSLCEECKQVLEKLGTVRGRAITYTPIVWGSA